jgi:hypothetical protein
VIGIGQYLEKPTTFEAAVASNVGETIQVIVTRGTKKGPRPMTVGIGKLHAGHIVHSVKYCTVRRRQLACYSKTSYRLYGDCEKLMAGVYR